MSDIVASISLILFSFFFGMAFYVYTERPDKNTYRYAIDKPITRITLNSILDNYHTVSDKPYCMLKVIIKMDEKK